MDYLAGYIEHLTAQVPDHIVVAGGDLVGAIPLISGLFHDEPTIETLNLMGLELSAVGNHEFDKGKHELLRMQHGGCFPHDQNTCRETLGQFEGAKFQYLANNIFEISTNKALFSPYAIKTFHGVKVAFIGATLDKTGSDTLPSNVAHLRFTDEAAAINATVRDLRRKGVRSFIVLVHDGGWQTADSASDINGCEGGLDGTPIQSVVSRLDDSVALVLSAHIHEAYLCNVRNSVGRRIPVTNAASYGRVLTDIDVTLDQQTRTITHVTARNVLVDRTNPAINPDPSVASLVERYKALAAPLSNRQIGSITSDIVRTPNAAGESPLGDLIADAELAATHALTSGGAELAFMQPGGIRNDLPFASDTPGIEDGRVTYNKLFAVQPFGNQLVTMTLTGSQIKTVLEEQFKGCRLGFPSSVTAPPSSDRLLQVSAGFTYTWNASAPACSKVDPFSIKINGAPVTPTGKYRVTINNLLVGGGDQFYEFRNGAKRVDGPIDLDALIAYLTSHDLVSPNKPIRITVRP